MAALVALALLAMGTLPTHARTPNLAALNLTLRDMPSGFTTGAAWVGGDARIAGKTDRTAAQLSKAGRLFTGYAEFNRSALTGIVLIGCEIAYYRDAPDAAKDYQATFIHASSARGATFKPLSMRSVGQQHAAYQVTTTTNGLTVSAAVIYFQRGPYVVQALDEGIKGTFDPASALIYARIVDVRLAKTLK